MCWEYATYKCPVVTSELYGLENKIQITCYINPMAKEF